MRLGCQTALSLRGDFFSSSALLLLIFLFFPSMVSSVSWRRGLRARAGYICYTPVLYGKAVWLLPAARALGRFPRSAAGVVVWSSWRRRCCQTEPERGHGRLIDARPWMIHDKATFTPPNCAICHGVFLFLFTQHSLFLVNVILCTKYEFTFISTTLTVCHMWVSLPQTLTVSDFHYDYFDAQ
jgi:hypothetical protein